MSRPRRTPLARDDSPAAMMAAGVPADTDDLEGSRATTRNGRQPRRAARGAPRPYVKHRAAPPTGRQVEPQCLPEARDAVPSLSMPSLPTLDLRRARTVRPATTATRRTASRALGQRLEPGLSVAEFLARLPAVGAAADLRTAADAIATARRGGHGVVLAMGALPIELGLSPLIVDLMERRVLTAVALSGDALVRDFELAIASHATAADAGPARGRGRSRPAPDTGATLNRILRTAASRREGLGEAVGRHLAANRSAQRSPSIAAAGARLGIPVTAHVALGTDPSHLHPSADGAALGATALRDLHRFASLVTGLGRGVYLSLGPAAPLPEVFGTALALARSVRPAVRPLLMIDLDVARRERPAPSLAGAPPATSTHPLQISGPHEVLLPLVAAAALERLAAAPAAQRLRRR